MECYIIKYTYYIIHGTGWVELKSCELCKYVNEMCNGSAGITAYLYFFAGHSQQ